MISPEQIARIRHLFYAEHWKAGTIASELGLHRATVVAALLDRPRKRPVRKTAVDPYLDFIAQTLEEHPRLRATRLYEMIKARGFEGSLKQLRRRVAKLRPAGREAFLSLRSFPGEQAQVDWASFGVVSVGRARRRLSCFVMTLSHSRALYPEFFFDQSQENFLLGHVRAFEFFGGAPRVILYDNLRSVVLDRRGDNIRFHPRIIELSSHYHFQPRACRPARGNEKGRVERAIRYIRESFFAARPFTTLQDFNRKARQWRDTIAHARPHPEEDRKTVAESFQEEQPRLLPLPAHPFDETDLAIPAFSQKRIYLRFDSNEYSIPPEAVGQVLGLLASDTTVRIFQGTTQIACHRRSYDRGERIEDPAHKDALLKEKRQARGASSSGRLVSLAPESETLLEAVFSRGESIAKETQKLLLLLDDYGAAPLRAAIQEALERKTPHTASVAYLLEKRRRSLKKSAPLPVDLSRRPDLADLHVQPHHPETYDELSRDTDKR